MSSPKNFLIRYIGGFLEWLGKAINEGFDVRSCFLWSLMDNFEWSAAYDYRFGIQSLNREILETKWKKSVYCYRDFIRRARGL